MQKSPTLLLDSVGADRADCNPPFGLTLFSIIILDNCKSMIDTEYQGSLLEAEGGWGWSGLSSA